MARNTVIAIAVGVAVVAGLLGVRAALVDEPLERLRRVDGAWEGSWYFPRGGPYILGFEAPGGEGTLSIDGRRLATREGGRVEGFFAARQVYEPGVHAVRFEASEGARLLWHPPGRRGPPEYVPPSSLSPKPPAQASFGGWVGASPVDGVVALLIALTIAVVVAFGFRRSLLALERRQTIATCIVFAVALIIRLVDIGGAGQTWDEDVNWSAGRNYVTNLLSLDFSQASWRWNYEHPPVMKYMAGIGAQFADGYGPARTMSALVMAFACALVVPIGRRLYDVRVGALGGLIAALTPHLIAHGKVVGHEALAVLWWTVAVYLCVTAHERSGGDAKALARRFAMIGCVLGLAIASRFANALLAPLIGALLLVQAPRRYRARTLALGAAIIPAVALVVLVAVWPRLWSEPVLHMQQAWARLSSPHGPEPYLGAVVGSKDAPWHYFAVYFVATAPVGVLVGAAMWLARTVVYREWRPALLIALWMVAPFGVMLSPVQQDGVRYILPALVPLAFAAGAGASFVADRIRRRGYAVVTAVVAAYLLIVDVRIHPYYLDYYGEHVGGPRHAATARAFEIGWWGEGVDRAIDYVNEHAAPGARVDKRRLGPSHLTWLRSDLWAPQISGGAWPSPAADWLLVNGFSLQPFEPSPDGSWRLAYEVSAQGAPLARVYRRGSPTAAPAP